MGELHGWATCPRCTTALAGDESAMVCPRCGSHYYANAAPTASAVIEDSAGRVLLGRRALEPFRGYWDTVGGFLHEDEEPEDGLRREVREETGLEIEIGRFLGVWMDRYGGADTSVHTLNLYWVVHATGGALEPADDVAELAWFEPDALPRRAELAFAAVASVLETWLATE